MIADRSEQRPRPPLQPRLSREQTVKIVGLGGVGSIVARYGSVMLAALAETQGSDVRLVLVDADSFEPSNATRMLYSRAGNKASVLRHELLTAFADSRLSITAVEEFVQPGSIPRLLHERDIVLLTVDNHATRKLVSDYCAGDGGWRGLDDICVISGGNDGVGHDSTGRFRRGTYGNCQVLLRSGGEQVTPSLTQHHHEIAHPKDQLPGEASCTDSVLAAPQILPANVTAAAAIVNTLWLHLCEALTYSELVFEIAEGLMRPVRR